MNILACPIDKHHPLELEVSKETSGAIEEGMITCSKCNREFRIENKIPILLPDEELTLPEKWWEVTNPRVVGNFMRGIDPHQQPIRCRIRDESLKVGNSVLDVGCATCIDYPLFHEAGAYYVGVDFTRRFLIASSKYALDVPVVQGDARKLPFKNEAFNSVYCKDLLVHLPPKAYEQVLKEMWRVTRKLVMIGFFGHSVDVATDLKYLISEPGTHGPVHWSYYPKAEIIRVVSSLPRFNDLKTERTKFEGYPDHPDYRAFYIAQKISFSSDSQFFEDFHTHDMCGSPHSETVWRNIPSH